MEIKVFVFNPFYENTLVVSSAQGNAFIIDPGNYESFESGEISNYIINKKLTIKGILNTHCHIDHVLGNDALRSLFKTTVSIPKGEIEIFKHVKEYAPQWGISNYRESTIDSYLQEGEVLSLDELSFRLLEVPGHSPGHLMFYEKNKDILIGGDVLFKESIGRTDLPGGNHEALLKNIKEKVYVLPDRVTVYPGHGDITTLGYEKRNNPFVKA